jgi:hypothetical protein
MIDAGKLIGHGNDKGEGGGVAGRFVERDEINNHLYKERI